MLICACNCIGSFFGTPWICTSTVRSISHATSLTYTTNTAALKIGSSLTFIKTTAIKDQRVSCLLVSILLGFSVLLSPVLKFIPYPVLFGMFLFMGITSLEGTQFFHRLCLILVPKKFHPHVTYVTRVGNTSKPFEICECNDLLFRFKLGKCICLQLCKPLDLASCGQSKVHL